jgi:hypothetical protein
VLAEEGITLLDSTAFLQPLLAGEGVLTRRAPNEAGRGSDGLSQLGTALCAVSLPQPRPLGHGRAGTPQGARNGSRVHMDGGDNAA